MGIIEHNWNMFVERFLSGEDENRIAVAKFIFYSGVHFMRGTLATTSEINARDGETAADEYVATLDKELGDFQSSGFGLPKSDDHWKNSRKRKR